MAKGSFGVPQRWSRKKPLQLSLDWTDDLAGVGYKRLYPMSSNYTDYDYILQTQQIPGDWARCNIGGDVDFDYTVNRGCTIAGLCIASIAASMLTGAGGGTTTYTVTVTLSHYDGVTETSLGSDSSSFYTTAVEQHKYAILCVSFNCTEKAFKKGDIIRVSISETVNNGGSGGFFIDPSGLFSHTELAAPSIESGNTRTIACRSSIDIPFKI